MIRVLAYSASKKLVCQQHRETQPTKAIIKKVFLANDDIREILVMRANTAKDRINGALCPENCEMHVLRVFGQLIYLS